MLSTPVSRKENQSAQCKHRKMAAELVIMGGGSLREMG